MTAQAHPVDTTAMSTLSATPLRGDEARRLTDEVKAAAAALWDKLLALYEGKAHEALGYSSWGIYFEAEFGQSGRQGYRLLDAAHVRALLPSDRSVNEGTARELVPLRDDPEAVRDVWSEAIARGDGKPTAAIVREVVRERMRGHDPAADGDHEDVEADVDAGDDGYGVLFASADTPAGRYRLGERLNGERLDGEYPPGRLKAIAQANGTTVTKSRAHVRFYESVFDAARRLEWEAERDIGWRDDLDLLPAMPAAQRRRLRTAFRRRIRDIEAIVEALRP